MAIMAKGHGDSTVAIRRRSIDKRSGPYAPCLSSENFLSLGFSLELSFPFWSHHSSMKIPSPEKKTKNTRRAPFIYLSCGTLYISFAREYIQSDSRYSYSYILGISAFSFRFSQKDTRRFFRREPAKILSLMVAPIGYKMSYWGSRERSTELDKHPLTLINRAPKQLSPV